MTSFQQAVLEVVKLIPAGKVMSYGQVAAYIGAPRAARQVGWAMHSLGSDMSDFPWWRVLNNHGFITIKGGELQAAQLQRELLQAEGIVVQEGFHVSMAECRYRPSSHTLAQLKLEPDVIARLMQKYQV